VVIPPTLKETPTGPDGTTPPDVPETGTPLAGPAAPLEEGAVVPVDGGVGPAEGLTGFVGSGARPAAVCERVRGGLGGSMSTTGDKLTTYHCL
jgi:hypothetical protein